MVNSVYPDAAFLIWVYTVIGLDKIGYQVSSFLISQPKRMLWVLIISALTYVFIEEQEKYRYFLVEKSTLSRVMTVQAC